MAFSQNPFSVATFGESYEQASPTVTLTGVQGTGATNTVEVRSIVRVIQTGVQADGAIGAPTLQAEAVHIPSSVAATGTANTVTATGGTGVVFTPSSVSATGAIDDATVVAKAVTVLTGVEGDIITDDPLVTGDEIVVDAEAVIAVTGVEGTSATNSVTIVAPAIVLPDSVELIGTVDQLTIVADASVNLADKGVSGTTAVDTVIVIAPADVIPLGVLGTFTVGDETVITVQFDYEAIKENYSRLRTVYTKETTPNTTRVAYVSVGENRTVYIESQPSNYRTVFARAA
jgi:hypothetical protein